MREASMGEREIEEMEPSDPYAVLPGGIDWAEWWHVAKSLSVAKSLWLRGPL